MIKVIKKNKDIIDVELKGTYGEIIEEYKSLIIALKDIEKRLQENEKRNLYDNKRRTNRGTNKNTKS